MVVETTKRKVGMNILVTGSSGMLGIALCDVLSKAKHRVIGLDLVEQPNPPKNHTFVNCDITDYSKLAKIGKDIKPDIIIHAAAFTDVDDCELNPEKAMNINGVGTRYIAKVAKESNAGLIYISTDFVFDGQKRMPYEEDDIPQPVNVYGKSKLDGEKFIREIIKNNNFFIIRTSWMFGIGGKNFVDTILKKSKTQKDMKVVSDQFGSPTYALDLANAIKKIVMEYGRREDIRGIYHITNKDNCSWYKLAQKTLGIARVYDVNLIPILSVELDRPAKRPTMSILNNDRYVRIFGSPLRLWEKALEDYIVLRK